MATKRDGRFYKRMFKRMILRGKSLESSEPDADLVEECRNSQEVLNPSVLQVERELDGRCYCEYAFLTPNQRDELFVKAFNRAVKQAWATNHHRGSGVATELKYNWIHPTLELNVPETRTAIRNARQHYDLLGLQYFPAINRVVQTQILYYGGYGLPRPNQLVSYLALDVLTTDDKRIREQFDDPFEAGSVDERFLACNHIGHWAQVNALKQIQIAVGCHWNQPKLLGRYLTEGLISESEARHRFGDSLVDGAITAFGPPRYSANGGSNSSPRTDRPACLGLSYDSSASVCVNCKVRSECVDITERVRLSQLEHFGEEDPRAMYKRKDAAARQRAKRRKDKPEYQAKLKAVRATIFKIMGIHERQK